MADEYRQSDSLTGRAGKSLMHLIDFSWDYDYVFVGRM
jgi:hypothetical protein